MAGERSLKWSVNELVRHAMHGSHMRDSEMYRRSWPETVGQPDKQSMFYAPVAVDRDIPLEKLADAARVVLPEGLDGFPDPVDAPGTEGLCRYVIFAQCGELYVRTSVKSARIQFKTFEAPLTLREGLFLAIECGQPFLNDIDVLFAGSPCEDGRVPRLRQAKGRRILSAYSAKRGEARLGIPTRGTYIVPVF